MEQTLLSPATSKNPINIKDQEYVTIPYNEPHDHLPVLWRVMTRDGNSHRGPIGSAHMPPYHAEYSYAYIYLDRMYNYKKFAKDNGNTDRLISEWAGKQIWDTMMHEFFHLYCNDRMDKSDTYNYVKKQETGKMVRVNYAFTRAHVWAHNERVIDSFATILTKIFFESPEWEEEAKSWYECFRDFDIILKGESKTDE